MLALSSTQKFVLYIQPTDMRKSFDSLSGLIKNELGQSPRNGHVFIFINKGRDKVKLLRWEGFGYTMYYKRLESGTYELPEYDRSVGSISLSYTQLVMLIDGLSIKNITRRKRYDYPQK